MPSKRVFPFIDPLSDTMHRRAVDVIQNPNFTFELPELSDAAWNNICNNSRERERLEFLGDALIGSSIAEELLRRWPDEGPGFCTISRTVLTANSTFAHLMHKIGYHDIRHPVKPAGDAFEAILAAYHSERGLEAFNQYVWKSFGPLLQAVASAYHIFRSNTRKDRVYRHHENLTATTRILGNAKVWGKRKKQIIQKKKGQHFQIPNSSSKGKIYSKSVYRSMGQTSNPSESVKAVEVIDLTSDDESDFALEKALLNLSHDDELTVPAISPAKKVSMEKPSSLPNTTQVASTSKNPERPISVESSPSHSDCELVESDIKSQSILQSISRSSLKGRLDVAGPSTQGKQNTQDDLASLLAIASIALNRSIGSRNNPISIE